MKDTNEQMNFEIQEAIKKNMPNQVGEILKQRLEQADKDALQVVQLDKMVTEKRKEIEVLTNTINEYKKLDERNSKLEEREKACDEKERNQKVFEAELKLAEAEKRNLDMVNLTGLVFRSPIYKSYVNEIKGGMTNWNQHLNTNQFVENGSKTIMTEKKEE